MPGNEIGRRRWMLRVEIYEAFADAVGYQKSIPHLAQYFDMGRHWRSISSRGDKAAAATTAITAADTVFIHTPTNNVVMDVQI